LPKTLESNKSAGQNSPQKILRKSSSPPEDFSSPIL
jgi:hypothetical protein